MRVFCKAYSLLTSLLFLRIVSICLIQVGIPPEILKLEGFPAQQCLGNAVLLFQFLPTRNTIIIMTIQLQFVHNNPS